VENALFLDFETHMEKGYTLKKMSARAYVVDPRFRILSVAIAEASGEVAFYYVFGDGEHSLDTAHKRVARAARDGKWLVVHNAGFDALILKLEWGVEFDHIFDTAGYVKHLGLHPSLDNGAMFFGQKKASAPEFNVDSLRDPVKLKEMAYYNAKDTALCRLIFGKALLDQSFMLFEWWVLDKACRDNLHGLRIDRHRAEEVAQRFGERRDQLRSRLCREYGDFDTNDLRRPKKVIAYCKERFDIELPCLDRSDPEVVEAKRINGRLGKFLALRESVISWEAAVQRARKMAAGTDRVYAAARYYGAHTGRFSGGGRDAENVNVQNLPGGKKGYEEMALLRGVIVPEPGCSFVSADLSSIEARVTAFLAGERQLLERFASGEDVYSWFAEQVFPGKTVAKDGPNSHLRKLGKEAILGLGFGMGYDTFFARLRTMDDPPTEDTARRIYDQYQRSFPHIRRLRKLYWTLFRYASQKGLNSHQNYCGFNHLSDGSGAGVVVGLPTARRLFYRSVRVIPDMLPWGEIGDQFWYADGYACDPEEKTLVRPGRRKLCSDGRHRYVVYEQILVENIVQAIARDILAAQMYVLEEHHQVPVAFHVHDELIALTPECTCPHRDTPLPKKTNVATLHEADCRWIAGMRTVETVMSTLPLFPKLKGLPVGCETNPRIRDRYGK